MSESKFEICIDSMLPEMTELVRKEMQDKMMQSMGWKVQELFNVEISKYLQEKVVPQMREELEQHTVTLRAAFVEALRVSCVAATDQIVKTAIKRMTEYEGDKVIKEVIKALFGK